SRRTRSPPTASRSRSGRTSTISSRPTRRRSRTNSPQAGGLDIQAARLLVSHVSGTPSDHGKTLVPRPSADHACAHHDRRSFSLSARVLPRRGLHRTGRRSFTHAFPEGVRALF